MPETNTLITLIDQLSLGSRVPVEYDVADWNMLLAQDLPGAESLDIPRLLGTLDDWAEQVKQETERLYYRFLDAPSNYENSQGYFCVLVLITVLERDLGVRYNPERVRDASFQDPFCVDPNFSDSQDLFIHGILDGPGGTCSSMPVLYTAVGRRLGYPMKLVEAPGHLFSRWDDPEGKFNGVPDRFNIDASGHGFACHPDEHYLTWPREWTDIEKKHNWYLKSLTPLGELAGFLATRAACLEDNGRLHESFLSFHWAYQLTKDKRYYQEAAKLQHQLERQQRAVEDTVRRLEEEGRERRQRAKKTSSKPKVKRGAFGGMAPLTLRDVGHGPSCKCLNCQRERAQVMAKSDGDFGHGPSCQCLHCRQNRQMAKPAGPPHGPPHQHLHSPQFP